jgi:hypothetical protein
VAAIVVVIALPLLLLAASLTLDGARGFVAAARTQKAADAAALAKATDCANGNTALASSTYSPYATDGTALVNVTCDTSSSTATATMGENVTLGFAAPFVHCPGNVCNITRSATAKWGSINGATVVPAVISACVLQLATTSPGPPPVFSTANQVWPIGGVGNQTCAGNLPGNFGWLDRSTLPSNTPCALATSLGPTGSTTVQGSNGLSTSNAYDCIDGINGGGLNTDVLFPVYTQTTGTGSNAVYTISGYAEFYITGWDLQHSGGATGTGTDTLSGGQTCMKLYKNPDCVQGHFVNFVTDQGAIGPSNPYGVTAVQLSS